MYKVVRIKVSESLFLKYKVYCAMQNISMTDQTNRLIDDFIKKGQEKIRIVKVEEN